LCARETFRAPALFDDLPPYITTSRATPSRDAPEIKLITMIDVPNFRGARANTLGICAWIVTSRAVVGSFANDYGPYSSPVPSRSRRVAAYRRTPMRIFVGSLAGDAMGRPFFEHLYRASTLPYFDPP